MADYEVLTCIACDAAMAAVVTRAGLNDGAFAPRRGRPLAPCGTHSAYDRHRRNEEPVDDACREAERVYTAVRRAGCAA